MKASPGRQQRRRRTSDSTPGYRATTEGIVLIVDDDETIRFVLQRALSSRGFIAIPVDDGGEIWPILERENVRVLVLDLNMPGVNGWEVLRRLRNFHFKSNQTAPRMIVISGQTDRATREFALRLGADAFLAKPLDLDQLYRALPPT